MHEMALAESVLQLIEDAAGREGFTRVAAIWLEIGRLACVESESLRFCFDVVAKDSIAENARLEIIETAGQGRCSNCGSEMNLVELYQSCPDCGSFGVRVTAGDAMRVREIEVE